LLGVPYDSAKRSQQAAAHAEQEQNWKLLSLKAKKKRGKEDQR
jgi:hypothetical protein